MNISFGPETVIDLCGRLLSFAIVFQAWEVLLIRSLWADENGQTMRPIWSWAILSREYSSVSRWWFGMVLSERGFLTLQYLRMISAVSVLLMGINLPCALIMFFGSWLTSVRFRGIYNGGSDVMTLVVASGVLFSQLAGVISQNVFSVSVLQKIALAYIAVQLTLSYFIAGLVKFKNIDWWRGRIMPQFFVTPRYDAPPKAVVDLFSNEFYARVLSIMVIGWEVLFPLSWFDWRICVSMLFIGFVFHLLNFWIFGFNRFVWAWVSAYPALLYFSIFAH